MACMSFGCNNVLMMMMLGMIHCQPIICFTAGHEFLREGLGHSPPAWPNGGWGLHTFSKGCQPSSMCMTMFSYTLARDIAT